MKQELVRINSIDGLEEVGILYSPSNGTDRIIIHVHGLNGNFYENRFLDTISKVYTDNNYALLTFNNRGKDYITEMNKGNAFGHLFFGIYPALKPNDVYASGKCLLKNRKLVSKKANNLFNKSLEVSEKLWTRIKEK